MGLFDQFPYTNFHELNLDWILKALKELEHTIEQFVAINALKYADPIQWNIVSQYEKNTIVIDPQSGTAYISVQPVPSGVALTNEDYWTVVFDLGQFVVRASKNFANTYEAETTLTATVSTAAGGWIVWGDTLYKALVNITAGDSYVVGGNIAHFTMEDVIGHLEDLTTTDKSNVVAAINEVAAEVVGKIGDLADLTTTDKSNVVAAINEVVTNLAGEATARENTDTQLQNDYNTKIGSLNNLDTDDKTNLVSAINEVNTKVLGAYDTADIRNYGGVADGVTDNTQAFNNCMSANNMVYLPAVGTWFFNSTLTLHDNESVIGDGQDSKVQFANLGQCFDINGKNISVSNLWFECSNSDSNILFRFRTDLSNIIEHIYITKIWSYLPYIFASDMQNEKSAMSYHPMFIYFTDCIARFCRNDGIRFSTVEGFLFFTRVAILYQGANPTSNSKGIHLKDNSGCVMDSCEVLGDLGNQVDVIPMWFEHCNAIWIMRGMIDYNHGTYAYRFTDCDAIYILHTVVSVCESISFLFSNCTHVQMVDCYSNGRNNFADYPSTSAAFWIESSKVNISGCMVNNHFVANRSSGSNSVVNINGCAFTSVQEISTDVTNNNFVNIGNCTYDGSPATPVGTNTKYDLFNGTTGAILTNKYVTQETVTP